MLSSFMVFLDHYMYENLLERELAHCMLCIHAILNQRTENYNKNSMQYLFLLNIVNELLCYAEVNKNKLVDRIYIEKFADRVAKKIKHSPIFDKRFDLQKCLFLN